MKRFLVILPILFMLGACIPTPTPSVTPPGTQSPNVGLIVSTLNGALRGADPLAETIDAKFIVTDVVFDAAGNPPVSGVMRVQVECEWVSQPSCTVERAFVALVHAIRSEGARQKIMEQIPETVKTLQVRAFDHMKLIGVAQVNWDDMLAFIANEITGEQLGTRVKHSNTP